MRLKALELVGFKSFVDRTVINFEDGVTGIVGPNGCGKSNVVDAIRWVMGEQSAKHLRGANMGDVIFNGTETRPAMGMASVFLTFDNFDGRAPAEYADYSEITVGRRLYRSGESEYFINKAPCRLKDIIDLFLGTGVGTKAYAIVEQGMIGQILSAKPEDRRTLIEEAAGISKFKIRKEAALRKMEATKTNLARLTDIITELERQTNSLYRQAKKAERFKTYSDELKNLELNVSAWRYKEWKSELDGLKSELEKIKSNEVSGVSELSTQEADIESAKLKLSDLEIELDAVQEDLYVKQNELQLTEAGISFSDKNIEGLGSQSARMESETAELENKISVWRADLDRMNGEKVFADLRSLEAVRELKEVDEEIGSMRDKHHQLVVELEDARRKVFQCVEQVSASGIHLEQSKRRDIEIGGWNEKDQAEIDRIDDEIKSIESKAGTRSGDVTGTRQMRLELENELSSTKETLNIQRAELEASEFRLNGLRETLRARKSRLNSLEELYKNFEGYEEGVKAVLKRKGEAKSFEGIFGTINDIVETDPKYENAVGAVLGEKLQYVVVKSHEVGVEAIDYLKTQASGRSTFVPMELRCGEVDSPVAEGEGVVGPLANYVNYADDYKKIVEYLFKDVVLVQDLSRAMNLWNEKRPPCTMVTMDGDVIDPAGVVTGGSGGDSSGRLLQHRREMKELTEAVHTLTGEANLEEQHYLKFKERVSGLQKNIEKLETESRHEELKLVNQEQDLHQLERELSFLRTQRDKLTLEISSLAEEHQAVKHEIETSRITFEKSSLEKAGFENDVIEKQTAESRLRSTLEVMTQKRTELNIEVRGLNEKQDASSREIDKMINSIAEAVSGIAERRAEIAVSSAEMDSLKQGVAFKKGYLHVLISVVTELKEKYSIIKNRYDADLQALREKEAGIRDLRRAHEDQMKAMHEIELNFTQKQERLSYLCREIFDRYRVDVEKSYLEFLGEMVNLEEASARVDELKDKLEKIGSVNVDAIKEYDELKVRYDFLKKQHDDLTASLDDLHKAIQKINRTSKVRFQEAFDSVNERFEKLFPKLFQGGKARLVLTDDQNVLESGVDIIAQPPGKKLQSITLLSGGEKALTAVALIFALFLHHPSPFCLLDEVDAPLDDANIDRFNEIIREMTKLSQFILITHNKRTMELADSLYGVTMEERGASKIISLSLIDKKESAAA